MCGSFSSREVGDEGVRYSTREGADLQKGFAGHQDGERGEGWGAEGGRGGVVLSCVAVVE